MSLTISRLTLTLSTRHRYLDDFFLNFNRFIKKYSHYKKIGYNSNVLQQVVNPITVGNYAFLFNCIQCSTHIRQHKSSLMLQLAFPLCWFLFRWFGGVAFVILDRFDGLFSVQFLC